MDDLDDQAAKAAITSEMIEAAVVALSGYQPEWERSLDRAYAICLEVEKARRLGIKALDAALRKIYEGHCDPG